MKMKLILITMLLLLLTSCAWVELTSAGKKVRVLDVHEVTTCKRIGRTTAKVKHSVAGLERKLKAVEENLEMLARNAAAEMGGDTIVIASPVKEGSRQFRVYKCVGQ